jgi:hypothetical protein
MTEPMVPVLRPRLPNAEALRPYLEEIDRNNWYSNPGRWNGALKDAPPSGSPRRPAQSRADRRGRQSAAAPPPGATRKFLPDLVRLAG